ncbi:uL30 family ribosomal protein [Nanoarchaeota archaeon]
MGEAKPSAVPKDILEAAKKGTEEAAKKKAEAAKLEPKPSEAKVPEQIQVEAKKEAKPEAKKPEKKEEPKQEKPKEAKPAKSRTLVAVLLRGMISLSPDHRHTLKMLNMDRKHTCIVVDDSSTNKGMLVKVKDYITWGEIDEATLKELVAKRGKQDKRKGTPKKYFSLHPPRGGLEKKGLKQPYKKGGALGYRGADINKLIRRML